MEEKEEKHLSDYERYMKELADAFEDECGDRCFPDMPEGQFVRAH